MSADDKPEIIRLTLSDSPMPDIQIDGMPNWCPVVWLAGAGWATGLADIARGQCAQTGR